MRDYAEVQVSRFTTFARNTKDPKRRQRFLHLAKRWRAFSLETDADRAARIDREITEDAARYALREKRRADSQARREATEAAFFVKQAARNGRILERHLPAAERYEARLERQRLRAARWAEQEAQQAAKRERKRLEAQARAARVLPPLPY